MMMGHQNIFSTIADYVRPTPTSPAEPSEKVTQLAMRFLQDIADMALWRQKRTIAELADEWSPPDHELV